MNQASTLGVVVAVQHAEANLPDIIQRLQPTRHADVDFIFCHTDVDPRTPELVRGPSNVRVLQGAAGSPIPHRYGKK